MQVCQFVCLPVVCLSTYFLTVILLSACHVVCLYLSHLSLAKWILSQEASEVGDP